MITPVDRDLIIKTQKRLDNLSKPLGALGKLEDIAKQICGITGKKSPATGNKTIFVFAADHGVTDEGVSAYPKEVTAQMVRNFLEKGAGINVLAGHAGARIVVADLGIASDIEPNPALIVKKTGYGTRNMAKGPAMTRAEALSAITAGIEIFETEFSNGIDIAGTGEMGIGNTTASSAITACFTGIPVEKLTGKGAGLDDAGLRKKIGVINKALTLNKPDPNDPVDVLAKVGGFEIAGLCGVILSAAAHKIPVVIDGFISSAAALIAYRIKPETKDYMIAAHASVENGQKHVFQQIGIEPLLNLNMRLGEGTGAALAMTILDASIKILTQMATFESAGVSKET
jgi:nicotinate-nucleotide--dimethylbenzimidazole phosphoribosyltransferase